GRIASGEAVVTIRREIVADALRPADEDADEAEFSAAFETFSWSAFRLEQLQHYAGTGPAPEWAALVKANRRWGKTHQRVHVIAEPLTPAMQEELTAGYPGNVAAGEDIGIVPVADGGWPAGVPREDFWLFDSSRLYLMRYNPDGSWAGATRVSDPERVVEACRARDAAIQGAIPWLAYIASRPELQRRVAQ
ncbi:MAG TPA: hypothetical protein VK599_13135, partial [Streptosporangiaceae bacterium]|nr:hypothetical protein [Streptosporangiaceae bacterium]